jgi:sugar phosphate isomerase/epimerase
VEQRGDHRRRIGVVNPKRGGDRTQTDVGWVLWAGTLGLESPISARVDGAVAAGCSRVSLGPADIAESGTTPQELGRSLRDAGLEIVVDPVMGWYGATATPDLGRYGSLGVDEVLRMADALGAAAISVVGPFSPDEVPLRELPERFAALCDRAADIDTLVHVEFMPFSAIADLAAAWTIVRDADRPNGGMLLDTWHFFRSHSDLALLEQVPGDRIFGVQVSDGPAAPAASLVEETFHRMLPGDGDLDLVGLLRTLHRIGGLQWVGPEVISPETAAMPPADAARVALERVRDLVAASTREGGR